MKNQQGTSSTPYVGEVDIYHRERRLKKAYERLEASSICMENKRLIKDFLYYKAESSAPSKSRQIKLLQKLLKFAEETDKPFKKFNAKDVETLLQKVNSKVIGAGRGMGELPKASTKRDHIEVLKDFFKWISDEQKAKELFKRVPVPKIEPPRKDPKSLVTWNEAVSASEHALSLRDKCIIQFLRDTGMRIEETLTLRVGDIERKYNSRGVVVHITKSKTEDYAGIRNPALRRCGKLILDYLEYGHPFGKNTDAILFCNSDGTPMTQSRVSRIIREAFQRAGIKKPCNPHRFRAANISEMSLKYSDAIVKKYHGLVPDTKVLKHYQFTDEEQANKRLLADMGIISLTDDGEAEVEIKETRCSWCKEYNPAGTKTCLKCGRTLDPDINAAVVERCATIDQILFEKAKKEGISEEDVFKNLIEMAIKNSKKKPIVASL